MTYVNVQLIDNKTLNHKIDGRFRLKIKMLQLQTVTYSTINTEV